MYRRSAETITLFTATPPPRRGMAPVAVSLLVHGVLFLPLSYLVMQTPRMADARAGQRNTVHIVDLHRSEPKLRYASATNADYHKAQAAQVVAAGGRTARPAVPKAIAQKIPAPETIVQPDLAPNLLTKEMPIPEMLLWSAGATPPVKIVPPAPHVASAADARPSLDTPNQVPNVADIRMTAMAASTDKLPVMPSTTSPVVREPQPEKLVPETTSQSLDTATRARVMTLSDIRMPEGVVVLPQVNETAKSDPLSPSPVPGPALDHAQGSGSAVNPNNTVGAGQRAEMSGDASAGRVPAQSGSKTTQAAAPATLAGASGMTTDHVELPHDGQFGVVVIGASLEDEYPEMVGQWSGRVAYTVYLHVGRGKSWILQYSLAPAAEAAMQGTVTSRLESPWPYDMVRPNLAPGDLTSDALMVHGILNANGMFEKLSVSYPQQFAQSKFVLDALQQWRFRPAVKNGQNVPVEVLLIIPNEQ